MKNICANLRLGLLLLPPTWGRPFGSRNRKRKSKNPGPAGPGFLAFYGQWPKRGIGSQDTCCIRDWWLITATLGTLGFWRLHRSVGRSSLSGGRAGETRDNGARVSHEGTHHFVPTLASSHEGMVGVAPADRQVGFRITRGQFGRTGYCSSRKALKNLPVVKSQFSKKICRSRICWLK